MSMHSRSKSTSHTDPPPYHHTGIAHVHSRSTGQHALVFVHSVTLTYSWNWAYHLIRSTPFSATSKIHEYSAADLRNR